LNLLRRVAADFEGLRVLAVGTYRELEARRAPETAALLAKLARHGTVRPLGGLGPSAVAQWIEETLRCRVSVSRTPRLPALCAGAIP